MSLDDLQNLLDNDGVINKTLGLGTLSGDEYYYLDKATFTSAPPVERNAYTWAPQIYSSSSGQDWTLGYNQIFIANTVLDIINKTPPSERYSKNGKQVTGHAYFVRGFAFFNLLSIFSKSYNKATSNTDLGIPLKVDPIVENIVQRSSVEVSYNQVLSDIKSSALLLQDSRPTQYRNRPSKAAAFALLARVYLSMRLYQEALQYADSCLTLHNKIIDYNSLDISSNKPFKAINDENICNFIQPSYSVNLSYSGYYNIKIDSTLYTLYDDNDLRKNIYYKLDPISQKPSLKSGMSGGYGVTAYSGLATDEVFLIKAECLVRAGKNSEAIDVVNLLLKTRYKTGTFQHITSTENIFNIILLERRKELIFRGTRWTDLKRLNLEENPTMLKRIIDGKTYTLLPNSNLYVLPIPNNEIISTGIKQNER